MVMKLVGVSIAFSFCLDSLDESVRTFNVGV